jgi:hypothetical protein
MALGLSLGIGFQNKYPLLYIEAIDFINTASITDSTEQNALIQLVIDLKNNNLWDKMDVIYPFVGGTSTSNSYNLKNTNQNRITWHGGVTHSTNGITGDGSNGYGDTKYSIPSPQTDVHLSVYIKNNIIADTNKQPYGAYKPGTTDSLIGFRLIESPSSSTVFLSSLPYSFIETNTQNFYSQNRNGSLLSVYKNGTLLNSSSVTTRDDNTLSIYLLGANYNNTSLLEPGAYNIAIFTAGKSLSFSKQLALYNIIQTFQTSLGRQV